LLQTPFESKEQISVVNASPKKNRARGGSVKADIFKSPSAVLIHKTLDDEGQDQYERSEFKLAEIEDLAPIPMFCYYCEKSVMTECRSDISWKGWTVAGICIVFGCVFGCCLIPLYSPQFRNTIHHCSECNKIIAIRRA